MKEGYVKVYHNTLSNHLAVDFDKIKMVGGEIQSSFLVSTAVLITFLMNKSNNGVLTACMFYQGIVQVS